MTAVASPTKANVRTVVDHTTATINNKHKLYRTDFYC